MTTTAPETPPDTSTWAAIAVDAPLPLEVAGALMQLIGAAWPTSVVSTEATDRWGDRRAALVMKVDHRAGTSRIGKRAAAKIARDAADAAAEADAYGSTSEFTGFRSDDDGRAWMAVTPPEELCLYLGSLVHSILKDNAEAVNYLEWAVHTKAQPGEPSRGYVLCAARSKGQTPHTLRQKAEAKLATVEAELADLRARISTYADELAAPDAGRHAADVRALLD